MGYDDVIHTPSRPPPPQVCPPGGLPATLTSCDDVTFACDSASFRALTAALRSPSPALHSAAATATAALAGRGGLQNQLIAAQAPQVPTDQPTM